MTATTTPAATPAHAPTMRAPHMGRLRTADGLELASYRWPAGDDASTPRATVALVHGLAEHAGRYAALAARLNAAGIAVLAVDLRGHGQSPGKRAWVERFDGYLDDADALVAEAARDNTPLFLMGHSMGGAIAALYAIERAPARGRAFAGLVLSSPALAPGRDVPRWMLALSRFISRVWPTFPAIRIDAALLSRDPAVVAANRADPLVHHGAVPARTGAEILDAMARIERGRDTLRVPVLVYHGTEDKLTEPDGSRAFGAGVGSPDRTLTLYEGGFHETMNDLERDRVIDALIAWLHAHAPAR
ncbi:alpha/beta hydrolase [Burkholderia pseudomultivorans]|uniref:Monoacylglycerol lipase n=1 Tax=Burkholderia pseudomultivorans TaxID=1207504 RepID=A0A6P2JM25_9BURK|nr:alpha/beta hydrolase [Burkholderia pseudomultivorans]MDR8731122.1 Monoacylglycerol lipase [Burkholderia pseudomultivorans]MDR8738340.1 Monoacylglycerol lipase [Burkholderia pseudomultivorans]MDR8745258.1 Monoacylglycerol lipase [Burkholderia pseudomultivorans]MDR8757414.1 Monoacylglycerol lipase [Burkholderia pseudomultivorans]MDR8781266.1 Monoacylglycerol lipase [Burkholderia pseudomultivorans]